MYLCDWFPYSQFCLIYRSYVSRLVFSIQDTHGAVDCRCVSMATPKFMFDWFLSPVHQKVRGNGVPYTIYREDIEDPVYPQDSLFAVTVEGYVILEDEPSLRNLVEEAWDSVGTGIYFFLKLFNHREINSVQDISHFLQSSDVFCEIYLKYCRSEYCHTF